jgi:hypothetical protein
MFAQRATRLNALDEGRAAYHAKRDYHIDNPYTYGSVPWRAWRFGWREARDQQAERHD